MQNIAKKDSDQSSVWSTSPCVVSCPSWLNSSGSQISASSISQSLISKMDTQFQHCHNMKPLGLQPQDQESSSTQSTGQSHHEVTTVAGGNHHGQFISTQSGLDDYGKHVESQTKPVLPLGTPDFVFPSQIGYSQSMARIPYPYAEPYMNGYLAAYGPQAVIHSQMIGMAPARVPLPLDVTDDEPIYVNAKQYRGILRRRQSRAKLEAQNKLAKGRKPYLHESRHLHALRRARGSGGRFLNTKKLQETKSVASDGHEALDSASLQQGRNLSESEVLQSETGTAGASATSDVTSISNSDEICRQPDPWFSVYAPRGGHSMQSGGVGIVCNGSELRVPIMR